MQQYNNTATEEMGGIASDVLVAKTYRLPVGIVEALRRKAFEERRTKTQILVEALRSALNMDDPSAA